MAYSLKYFGSGSSNRVYVVMGDGELDEGNVWEAAMFAAHYRLDNITAIVDRNRIQIDGDTESVMALGDLGHQALASRVWLALRFFRWISSREMAAGVTPGMRPAWPSVSGRVLPSLP